MCVCVVGGGEGAWGIEAVKICDSHFRSTAPPGEREGKGETNESNDGRDKEYSSAQKTHTQKNDLVFYWEKKSDCTPLVDTASFLKIESLNRKHFSLRLQYSVEYVIVKVHFRDRE